MTTTIFNPAPDPPSSLGRYRLLSPKASVRVSPLCLGGMSLGQAWKDEPLISGGIDKADSFKLLDAFWEKGGNFIDTANSYQVGVEVGSRSDASEGADDVRLCLVRLKL